MTREAVKVDNVEDDSLELDQQANLAVSLIEGIVDSGMDGAEGGNVLGGQSSASINGAATNEETGSDNLLPIPLGHDRSSKKRTLDVQTTGSDAETTFEDLQLKPEVLLGLQQCFFVTPSPVQCKAIPMGKFGIDLILQSKSGTGKTCAFGVIILENIDLSPEEVETIQAVVISPTRELACQTKKVISFIGCKMQGLIVKDFIGGTSVSQSIKRSKNCNVVSGTPGRILHMINEGEMDLSHAQIIVLDEADRLMESSFVKDVTAIFRALPSEKQVIAASATYPDELKEFVKQFMREPAEVTTDPSPELLGVQLYAADVLKILDRDFKKGMKTKPLTIAEQFDMKMKVIMQILQNVQFTQVVIFCTQILVAEKVYYCLKDVSFDVALLTGALCQATRLQALNSAQSGKCKILVTTDLGARGIDVEGIDLVINFELPEDASTFIHRYGRAGRFGSDGTSISLVMFRGDYARLYKCVSKHRLTIHCLTSAKNIEQLGKTRVEKLRRIARKDETISGQVPGFDEMSNVLNVIFNEPFKHFDEIVDSTFGFKIDLDNHDLIRRVAEIERKM